ncbi:Ornithine decarboxylase [Zalerion maritima]|uniref:Ornithine decarboxylase n=1 Tax=Zalerion maritima TaxID=339359 RepID=A0AAD5RU79_9PEZI|nr:Ornithine decarboxylase [Zalerion maritima]
MVMATAAVDSFAPVSLFSNINNVLLKKRGFFDHQNNGSRVNPKQLIGDAIRHRIETIDPEYCEPGEEDAFFVADLGEVYRQHLRWKLNLPRVKPFYAVKANPDPKVLELLAAMGTGFDCASKNEIDLMRGMGVDPQRIIYAQPCKTMSYIRHARQQGVKQMTFDNDDELRKIARLYPDAELFLRIMTDDSASLCRLSLKFGAPLDTCASLIQTARELGLNLVGVSFHVGSGASDPMAFLKSVQDAHYVFKLAENYGYDMKTLDVGGGFCGESFEPMAKVLREALDEYFPTTDIIAEPGRYYVSSAFTIACNIIARRTVEPSPSTTIDDERSYMLYINDGAYGNFSSIIFDHQHPVAKILTVGDRFIYGTTQADESVPGSPDAVDYSIWGPSCDGLDRVMERQKFDAILETGDWLYFEDMGAYTRCSATKFNGFRDDHDVLYVCSEPGARAMLRI